MLPKKFYIALALVALMLVGFIATSTVSYFVANESISDQLSSQTLPLTSDNIYTEIQRDLLRPILISSVMASDTFLRDWVMDGERELGRIEAYLREIQNQYGMITAYFVSEQSRNYYHASGLLKQVHEDDIDDTWYFRVRNLREPYEINIDQDTADRNRLSIFINYRMFDQGGNYLGATGVGLSLESVTRLLDTYEQRYGRSIYFTDRQGNVTLTAHNNQALFQQNLRDRPGLGSRLNQIISMPSASLNYTDEEGEPVFLNSRLVPEFDWYLVVEQHGSSGAERMRNIFWTNIGIALGIMLVVMTGAWFTLKSYQRQLEEMATTDRLTGTANRHVFEAVAEHVLKSTQRKQRPVSFVLFDIDAFKSINDAYGHNAGDLVLKTVANIISSHVRDSDTLCRWGGEEFILLMEECSISEATERARHICEAVRQSPLPLGKDSVQVTLSCGIGEHKPGEQLSFIVNRVDKALYQAKNAGRDQIAIAE